MESLESKLDRLSPEQRKETEDFVDFLLSRSGKVCSSPETSADPFPVTGVVPPPLTLIEPSPAEATGLVGSQDLTGSVAPADTPSRDQTVPEPFHEIGGNLQDRITHDYMDYGQFESHPSLATEAVKKVKRKLIAREEQDKPRHLLDWVD